MGWIRGYYIVRNVEATVSYTFRDMFVLTTPSPELSKTTRTDDQGNTVQVERCTRWHSMEGIAVISSPCHPTDRSRLHNKVVETYM